MNANSPPVGSKRGKGRCEAEPKNIGALDRLKNYNEETFVSTYGCLFCSLCREEVSLKRSIMECRIVSQKHEKGKEQHEKKNMKDQSISQGLNAYDSSIHREKYPGICALTMSKCCPHSS